MPRRAVVAPTALEPGNDPAYSRDRDPRTSSNTPRGRGIEPGMNTTRLTLPELLVHAGWVRRLARQLTSDAEVDDAVQETWIAALRSPPDRRGETRGWLGRVVGNVVRTQRRGRSRRTRREWVAAGEDGRTVATPLEVVVDAELHSMLAALVNALPDPVRETVILRFFDGLSAAEIARRTNVPAGTVRWRLKQGLDRLRAALDERHGGDRAAWCAALSPLGGSAPGTRGPRWLAMPVAAAVVVVVTAVAVRSPPATSAGAGPRHTVAGGAPADGAGGSGASTQGPRPARDPRRLAAALAAVHSSVPPGSAARAEAVWAGACPSPAGDGLCTTSVPSSPRACPRGRAVGERLVATPRADAARAEALAILRAIAGSPDAAPEARDAARLRLGEDAFEALLRLSPPEGPTFDGADPQRAREERQRFLEWLQDFSKRTDAASAAFLDLARNGTTPEVKVQATARAGQVWAEAARLLLSIDPPATLPETDRRGNRPRDLFCTAMADKADPLLARASSELKLCARRAAGAAAEACRRELSRIPAELR
jgi:RNA polymerase sigma-70 factor (ECF subfamily)